MQFIPTTVLTVFSRPDYVTPEEYYFAEDEKSFAEGMLKLSLDIWSRDQKQGMLNNKFDGYGRPTLTEYKFEKTVW